MDAATARKLLIEGIDKLLSLPFPLNRTLSSDQKAVLFSAREQVVSDNALCERIAHGAVTYQGEMMAYNLVPLATALDDAPKVLIGYFTGEVTDYWEIGHALHHLESFALGQLHKHPIGAGAGGSKAMTDDEFKSCLEQLAGHEGVKGYGAIDWKAVLLTVAQLLMKLLLEA